MWFSRKDITAQIQDVQTCTVRWGYIGTFGNKGAVVVRFQLQQTSVICAWCHLTSGQNEYHDRIKNWIDILEQSFLDKEDKYLFDSHQVKILFGDLNFRIHSTYAEVVSELKSIDEESRSEILSELLKQDQLILLKQQYKWLDEYKEMPIYFLPTYKYDPGTDVYDTSKKARVPSWWDRILFCQNEEIELITPLWYQRKESLFSDHRPVLACFILRGTILPFSN